MIFDRMPKEVVHTTKRLIVWSIICSVALAGITLTVMCLTAGWQTECIKVIAGFASGCFLACFMAVHMASSLSKSVELSEGEALKKTRIDYLIRTTVVLAVFTALYFTGLVNILAMLGGVLSLKPATYIQMFFQDKNVPDDGTGEEIQ